MTHSSATTKYRPGRILAILITAVLLVLPGLHTADAREVLDRVVAVVNEGVILQSQLDESVEMLSRQMQLEGQPAPPPAAFRRQVLEREVINHIQLERAERAGIRISEEAVNNAMAEIARSNNLSLDEFVDLLAAEGMNFETFRREIRNQMAIQQLRQREIQQRVNVTEREVDNFLANQARDDTQNEYRLRHILLSLADDADPDTVEETRALGEEIRQRAQAGEDFAELAMQHSDSQQALEGGDLGWRRRAQLPTLFEELVDELDRGQISQLIRAPNGFHLVKLEDRRGSDPIMVEEIRARHILIRPTRIRSEAQVIEELREIRERVLAGEDFAELAPSFSSDSVSAAQGGHLGWVRPGQMVPEFEDQIRNMRPGQISEPFETRFGWHIVEVRDRRERDMTTEARRTQARQAIFQRKAEEETERWLRRLRDEAFVEIRLE